MKFRTSEGETVCTIRGLCLFHKQPLKDQDPDKTDSNTDYPTEFLVNGEFDLNNLFECPEREKVVKDSNACLASWNFTVEVAPYHGSVINPPVLS